ncbi:MAG: FAD-dependent oxidoreductase [Magnetococcales bacterium]|nr:FAD-dependent oxidoreductase [Magnetococcales bacterium]
MNPIVIVGTGLAGYGVARELRKNGYEGALTMVTADDGRFYSKPMLSGALAKGKDADALATADAGKMAADLNAEILTRRHLVAIDSAAKTITVDEESLSYGTLVLAMGASPIRLPLKGEGAEEVLSVNNLADYARFLERLEGKERVAIIGPGLIGSEFANDLLTTGRQVDLIGPDAWPIASLLPEMAGRAVQKQLEEAGGRWHLETFNGPIERHGSGYQTTLKNGTVVEADLVVSAVGVRAEIALAEKSGLAVNRGIVTDHLLRTSAPDIYAVGDCAEVEGRNLPYVAPLMIGTKALAKTLTGTETPVRYPHMPVVIKTTLHPVVTLPPAPGSDGAWQVEGGDSGVVGRFLAPDGTLNGWCVTGDRLTEKGVLLKEISAT